MFQTRQSRRRRGRRQRRQRRAATAQRRRSVIHFLYLFACDVCLTPASLSLSLFSSPGESFKRACAFVDKTEKFFLVFFSLQATRERGKSISLWTKKSGFGLFLSVATVPRLIHEASKLPFSRERLFVWGETSVINSLSVYTYRFVRFFLGKSAKIHTHNNNNNNRKEEKEEPRHDGRTGTDRESVGRTRRD
jgi:hypothetical protein